MAQVKKTDRNPKDCGQPYGENIPQKNEDWIFGILES